MAAKAKGFAQQMEFDADDDDDENVDDTSSDIEDDNAQLLAYITKQQKGRKAGDVKKLLGKTHV